MSHEPGGPLDGGQGPYDFGALGDDVGTLVVDENDLAYGESGSGNLTTWLTTRKIDYNWVC